MLAVAVGVCADEAETIEVCTARDASRSASLGSVIAVATDLRMNCGNSQFRTLDDRLRVRMLTGWVHEHTSEHSAYTASELRKYRGSMFRLEHVGRGSRRCDQRSG